MITDNVLPLKENTYSLKETKLKVHILKLCRTTLQKYKKESYNYKSFNVPKISITDAKASAVHGESCTEQLGANACSRLWLLEGEDYQYHQVIYCEIGGYEQ